MSICLKAPKPRRRNAVRRFDWRESMRCCCPVEPVGCCDPEPADDQTLTVTDSDCPACDGVTFTISRAPGTDIWTASHAPSSSFIAASCDPDGWYLSGTLCGSAPLASPVLATVATCDPFYLMFENVTFSGGPCNPFGTFTATVEIM